MFLRKVYDHVLNKVGYYKLPLHEAIYLKKEASEIGELIANGAKVNQLNMKKETPLYFAMQCGANEEIIDVLLEHNADVNIKCGKMKNAALHMANNVILVKKLLKHGANINCCNVDNKTPLHIAAELDKDLEVLQELIYSGANVRCEDKDECTPLDYFIYNANLILNFERYEECKTLYMDYENILRKIQQLLIYGAGFASITALHSDSDICHIMVCYILSSLGIRSAVHYENIQGLVNIESNLNQNLPVIALLLTCFGRLDMLEEEKYQSAICEITRMQREQVNTNVTLFHFIVGSYKCRRIYSAHSFITNKYVEVVCRYPIYWRFIYDKVFYCSIRANIVDSFKQILVNWPTYAKHKMNVENVIYSIAEYLSCQDITHFILSVKNVSYTGRA